MTAKLCAITDTHVCVVGCVGVCRALLTAHRHSSIVFSDLVPAISYWCSSCQQAACTSKLKLACSQRYCWMCQLQHHAVLELSELNRPGSNFCKHNWQVKICGLISFPTRDIKWCECWWLASSTNKQMEETVSGSLSVLVIFYDCN